MTRWIHEFIDEFMDDFQAILIVGGIIAICALYFIHHRDMLKTEKSLDEHQVRLSNLRSTQMELVKLHHEFKTTEKILVEGLYYENNKNSGGNNL